MIFLRYDYEPDLRDRYQRPSDFVGPFPNTDIAVQHRLVYGPIESKVVRLEKAPDNVMTPGQAVDYQLERY